ncbi:MAG: phosphonate ABC transporter, permease protein PhnE, partial [Variibacter sp.]|nr:phosphonate ABC transporter, permease protein PhnE [Variibacter sp.]
MPVLLALGRSRTWRRRTRAQALAVWLAWLALVAVTVFCWRVMTAETIWSFVWDAPRQAADIFGRMLPPRWDYANRLWAPLWDTINIATLGTLLAILLGTPLGFLAARNTTPSLLVVRPLALLVIVSSRSINALIWGLLLVAILGPGVLAGIIAIALRSIGFIGKLLYEAIE